MGIMLSDTMRNTSNAYKKKGLTSSQYVLRILMDLSLLYDSLLLFDVIKNQRFNFNSHRPH